MATASFSTIGMALAGKSACVDIPKPREGAYPAGRDSFAAVTAGPHAMLPTPPNSISPNLPAHRRRDSRSIPALASPPPAAGDTDMDLADGEPGAGHEPAYNALSAEALDSLGDLDSAGAITPGMLAKHHLPDVLLAHGPLAIRHVMGYLTTSVPGFSRIASAKARRLVVAALEGRGSGTDGGGGLDGDVVFDKVGWGRWDARVKGQPPRDRQAGHLTPPGSLPSSYSQAGLQIPGQRSWTTGSDHRGTSVTGNSAVFSHSESYDDHDRDMLEHEADKMSLDGPDDGYASSSPAPDDDFMDHDLGSGDETEEEDWEAIGADALRARSLPVQSEAFPKPRHLYQPVSYSKPKFRSSTPASHIVRSVPTRRLPPATTTPHPLSSGCPLPTGAGGVNDSQERAAIEALLSLGAM